MPEFQLTIDGGEELLEPGPSPYAPFTAAQVEILRLIASRDITSTEAGRIVHAHREPPCPRCAAGRCPYLASDGCDALKRLMARGFVRRVFEGLWTSRERK